MEDKITIAMQFMSKIRDVITAADNLKIDSSKEELAKSGKEISETSEAAQAHTEGLKHHIHTKNKYIG